jgi:hypothetical protein
LELGEWLQAAEGTLKVGAVLSKAPISTNQTKQINPRKTSTSDDVCTHGYADVGKYLRLLSRDKTLILISNMYEIPSLELREAEAKVNSLLVSNCLHSAFRIHMHPFKSFVRSNLPKRSFHTTTGFHSTLFQTER